MDLNATAGLDLVILDTAVLALERRQNDLAVMWDHGEQEGRHALKDMSVSYLTHFSSF